MRRLFTALILLAGLATSLPAADSFPQPSPFPKSWELKFQHGLPKRVVVGVPGKGEPKAYWYIAYRVTNESKKEQTFLPEFDLVTRDGKIYRSDRNIPNEVYKAIQSRERNKYLEPAVRVSGELRIGEDEARDSVAVWEEPLKRMGEFTFFVAGLSGEFANVTNAQGVVEKDENGRPVVLRKTLQLTYHINGDEVSPGEDVVNPGQGRTGQNAENWVMR